MPQQTPEIMDPETEQSLSQLTIDPKILANRVPGVQSVLFVLSSRGMVFDLSSLRHKTQAAYPGAKVYFATQSGHPIGEDAPSKVDLLVDFTGPRERQGVFIARRWRRQGRVVIGRHSGFFRTGLYDKIFEEIKSGVVPHEQMDRERFVQRTLLEMAGIAILPVGDAHQDRGKITPLTLPWLHV